MNLESPELKSFVSWDEDLGPAATARTDCLVTAEKMRGEARGTSSLKEEQSVKRGGGVTVCQQMPFSVCRLEVGSLWIRLRIPDSCPLVLNWR